MRLGKWNKQNQRGPAWPRWVVAGTIAVLLQIPLFALIFYVIENSVSDIDFASVGMENTAVWEREPPLDSVEVVAVNLPIVEPEEPEEKPLPDEIDGSETPVGQIVSVAPVMPEAMPDEAEFAARFAQQVEEQMRARQSSKQLTPPIKYATEKTSRRNPAPAKGSEKNKSDAAVDEKGAVPSEEGDIPAEEGLGKDTGNSGERDGFALRHTPTDGLDPVRKYSPSAAPFASDDFIPNVDKEGETNLLNTAPYRYAGFFERVKGRVRMHWDPNTPYMRRDPSGQTYGHKDRLTVLRIVLDEDGNVLDTTIKTASGLKFLDDEAVRAFYAAGPFVNPPKGLIKEGRIRFEFGFAFLVASSRHQFFWRW